MGGGKGGAELVGHCQPPALDGNNFWEGKAASAARFNCTDELQKLFASLCPCPSTPAGSPGSAVARTTLPKHQLLAHLAVLDVQTALTALPSQNSAAKTKQEQLGKPQAALLTPEMPQQTFPSGGCCHGKKRGEAATQELLSP